MSSHKKEINGVNASSRYTEKTVMSIEEDSEPILGLWFEETIAPSDGSPANGTKESNNETNAERTVTTIVPDNREPHGVSELVFSFYTEVSERY